MVVYKFSLYFKWIDKDKGKILIAAFCNRERIALDDETPRAERFDEDLVNDPHDSDRISYELSVKEARKKGLLKEGEEPYFRGFHNKPDPDMEKVMDISIKTGIKRGGKIYVKDGDFQRYVFMHGSTASVNQFQEFVSNYKKNLKIILITRLEQEDNKEMKNMLKEIDNAKNDEEKGNLITKLNNFMTSKVLKK